MENVLCLITAGEHDRAAVAEQLGLNPRTLTRLIQDLRAKGHRIVVVLDEGHWSYRLATNARVTP